MEATKLKEIKNGVWRLLHELSHKEGITDVVINGPNRVFVERAGRLIFLNTQVSENDISDFCQDVAKLNDRKFDESCPILDGLLQDGSRINIIGPPVAFGSPAISIRKYLRTQKELKDGVFGLTSPWIQLLKSIVKAKKNVIVSGGTGAGKTTFLGMLLREVPVDERLVILEDTMELQLTHSNVVRLEVSGQFAGHTHGLKMRDLVKNCLRMRPDRIIVGEVRGEEVVDLLQAMNTGHEGSMATVHANSTGECLSRLETLCLFSGIDLPIKVVRAQMAKSIDFVVQLEKNREGERKISAISEITKMEGDTVLMGQIGALSDDGVFRGTGVVPSCAAQLVKAGLPPQFFTTKY